MSDPLEGYVVRPPQGKPVDPLDAYVVQPWGTPEEEPPPDELSSAVGRNAANQRNLQENIARLQAIKPANPEHKARIDKLLAYYQRQLPRGWGFVPGTTEPEGFKGGARNFLASFFAEATNEGLMAGAGLVGDVIAPFGAGPFAGFNERIEEAKANVREGFGTPGGLAGASGGFAGAIAGGVATYGAAAMKVSESIARRFPKTYLGQVAAKGAGGNVRQRVISNLIGGTPLNVVMAIGEPFSGDPRQDLAARAKQFGIGVVSDVIFGLIPTRHKTIKSPDEVIAAAREKPASSDISPERTAEFVKTVEGRKVKEQIARYEAEAKVQARAEWQLANRGKKWADPALGSEGRKAVIAAWKERNPMTDTLVLATTEDQVAAATALDLPAKPIENPVEVAATVAQVQRAIELKGAHPEVKATDVLLQLQKDLTAEKAKPLEPETGHGLSYKPSSDMAQPPEVAAWWDKLAPIERRSTLVVRTGLDISGPTADISNYAGNVDKDYLHLAYEVVHRRGNLELVPSAAEYAGPPDVSDPNFHKELVDIAAKPLSPEQHAAEVKELLEAYTPLPGEVPAGDAGGNVPGVTGKGPTVSAEGAGQGEPNPAKVRSEPTPADAKKQLDLDQHLRQFNDMSIEAMTGDKPASFLEQLQGMYNVLKEHFGLTDEQIAEQQMRAFEEHDPGADDIGQKVQTESGVGAEFNPELLESLGANMYEGDVSHIAAKEGLQNAIDAVRPLAAKGIKTSIKITLDPKRNRLTFEDDGTGMPPAIVVREFVDPGRTTKADDLTMSGKYGLAKIALFAQSRSIYLETIAEVDGKKIMTILVGDAKTWTSREMQISSHVVSDGTSTGSKLELELQDKIDPEDGSVIPRQWNAVRESLGNFVKFNHTSTDMEVMWKDRHTGVVTSLVDRSPGQGLSKEYDPPIVVEKPSAKLTFEISKKQTESSSVTVHVLNNGLYQFTMHPYIGEVNKIPESIVVDVQAKVGVKDERYPFTTNRERLKSQAGEAVSDFANNLKVHAQRQKATKLTSALLSSPSLKDSKRLKVYATDENLSAELVDEIAAAPYLTKLMTTLEDTIVDVWHAAREQYPNISRPAFGGAGIGSDYLGINIQRGRMFQFAQSVDPDFQFGPGQDKNLVLFNPYVTLKEVVAKVNGDPAYTWRDEIDVSNLQDMTPEQSFALSLELAHSTIGTMFHEMAHEMATGHQVKYTGVITRILSREGRIHEKLMEEYTAAWEDLLQHKALFNEHLVKLIDQWGSDNVYKDFSGHLDPEDGGSHPHGGDAAKDALRGAEGSNAGGTGAGGGRGESVQPPGGKIPEGGGSPAELPGITKGDGFDAERQSLFRELVKTPIAERGPILLKLRELAARKVATKVATQLAPKVVEAAKPVEPRGTFLESMPHKKSIESMHPRDVETLTNNLLIKLENAPKGSNTEAMHRDLEKLLVAERSGEQGVAEIKAVQPPPVAGGTTRPEAPPSVTGAEQVTRTVEAPVESLDPKIARKLFQSPLRNMSDADLSAHIEDMQSRVSVLGKDEGVPYRTRLDDALGERAERWLSQGNRLRLQIPPGAGGFTAGFIGGYLASDDDTDRLTNALMWGIVGAGVGAGAGRLVKRGQNPSIVQRSGAELPGGIWQEEMQKYVITDYERGRQPISFREKMRMMYTGIVRRSLVAERFMQSAGASRLGTESNAAKLLTLYGRWTGQTESALKYGPALFDEFGNYLKLNSLGFDAILRMVDGDVETLGALMAARTKVEMGESIKTPFDTLAAEKMFFSVPEKYHKAADEMRKFNLAMAEVLVDGGLLSRDGLAKFSAETMYATLQRVFKMDSKFATSAEAKASSVVGAATPLKARAGGGEMAIKNPVEATIAGVPWYYRAAEQNKIKSGLVDAWEAAGSPSVLMRRVAKSDLKVTPEHEAKIAQLMAEIKGLTSENAQALVAGLDPKSIDPLEGTMRIFRNGQVESYRMPTELALSLQTMNNEEIGVLYQMLGIPARIATKGVTYNPFFLAKMGFFDMFQATLNSKYGFRPGIDNVRGWLHIVMQSKKYQEALGVGFSHQSFAASRESFSTKLASVRQNIGSPLEVAVKQMKEFHPIEAYKTLIAPIGDAARIGEYLRALDHGANTIEAVFAAKHVTANYGEIGQFAQMRALNHIIMFLNPALQVMDTTFYRAGVHPFRKSEEGRARDAARYITKAFFSITVPSYLLWAKYHDDEEITQMRQTRAGARYWWMRSPVDVPGVVDAGQIVKIPKPLFDGQIWGTTMEATLDNWKGTDPVQATAVAKSILRDAAFNILPTIGQIPYSLQVNQDLSWGGPIIPLADDQLALEHRGEANASWISRELSGKIAPSLQGANSEMLRNAVTPAGLDYIFRSVGGMLGADAVLAISQAMETQTKGYIPAKEELPIIKNVVVDYPNVKVRDIEQFYDRLDDVQTVGSTINHLAREDPVKLVSYMVNNQANYMLIKSFSQSRQAIANYRRAIVDIKRMDASMISSEDRRVIIKQYVTLMQTAAGHAMMQARTIDQALEDVK